ncbi:MAG: B12-binding domain-containing radical SAM protein [Planctomycetota bacterium]|jgi:radical SAM superfamily enzyme YgiQ (UPF0313 family)
MRVTLVFPSVGRKTGRPYVRAWQMEPLVIALLASLTPDDIELRFYDDRLEDIPFDEQTDLVAMTVETFTALRAYRLAREFRRRGVPVVLGGYHVTLLPDEAQAEADAIVVGDAEPVWEQVIEDARNDRLLPRYEGDGSHSLAGIRPHREIFAGKRYLDLALVESSRGCGFRCDFCSITAAHAARQRHRPPQDVANEIAASGRRNVFLIDDNIVGQPERTRELCLALLPLGIRWVGQASIHIARDDELLDLMRRSGCLGVLIGMESLDPRNLAEMGKGWNLANDGYAAALLRFREHGLGVYGTFLFGYDQDDHDAVDRSVTFAREARLFLAAFNHVVPFPGTPLYERLRREGRLLTERWWLDPTSRVGDVSFRPARVSPRELERICLEARKRFYGWGSMLERLRDRKVNACTAKSIGTFLALNLQAHFDIERRQGLQIGAGQVAGVEAVVGEAWREPVPVPARHA